MAAFPYREKECIKLRIISKCSQKPKNQLTNKRGKGDIYTCFKQELVQERGPIIINFYLYFMTAGL